MLKELDDYYFSYSNSNPAAKFDFDDIDIRKEGKRFEARQEIRDTLTAQYEETRAKYKRREDVKS